MDNGCRCGCYPENNIYKTLLIESRYAFDVLGELLMGKMFGFMEKSYDHGSFISSLSIVQPILTVAAVAPTYCRPLIIGFAIIFSRLFKGLKASDGILEAAVSAVKQRKNEADHRTVDRIDLLAQLMRIVDTKGEENDFTLNEVTLETWAAMYVRRISGPRFWNTYLLFYY